MTNIKTKRFEISMSAHVAASKYVFYNIRIATTTAKGHVAFIQTDKRNIGELIDALHRFFDVNGLKMNQQRKEKNE